VDSRWAPHRQRCGAHRLAAGQRDGLVEFGGPPALRVHRHDRALPDRAMDGFDVVERAGPLQPPEPAAGGVVGRRGTALGAQRTATARNTAASRQRGRGWCRSFTGLQLGYAYGLRWLP
jgi:hypothetical protein